MREGQRGIHVVDAATCGEKARTNFRPNGFCQPGYMS